MSMRSRTSIAARAATVVAAATLLASVTGCTPARETVMVRGTSAPAVSSNDTAVAGSSTTQQPVYRFGAGDGVGQSNYRIYRDEVLNVEQAN